MGKDFIQIFRELKVIGTHQFIPHLHVHACRIAHRMIVLINLSTFTNLFRFFPFSSSYSNGIQTPGRHVRTRLYFTSESHVHSLLSAIRYGGLLDVNGLVSFAYQRVILFVFRHRRTNNGNVRWSIWILFLN